MDILQEYGKHRELLGTWPIPIFQPLDTASDLQSKEKSPHDGSSTGCDKVAEATSLGRTVYDLVWFSMI